MRFGLLVPLMLFAQIGVAQVPVATNRPRGGATVSGVVRDSIARSPLTGAMVQLVAVSGTAPLVRAAVSDSLGRFALDDVPEGRFALGFFHPMLDSLGIEAPLREVSVDGNRPVRVDLAIPSPARLRAAICGSRSVGDSGAVLVGFVRDAERGRPVAGVTVTGEWLEISFRKDGMLRRVPRVVATTGENGWFAMCNVPSDGTMAIVASRGADSTDVINVDVPARGFLRRELFLGPARTVLTGDTSRRGDASAPASRRMHVGNGLLTGTVESIVGRKPLAGAQVRIADGPVTRANDRGEWTLANAPAGTRMLEVRALGYYPERRRVDVVAGAPPLLISLSTLKTVLDTVRILASRRVYDRDRNGFQQRQRSGIGRYLTPEDISRHRPNATSDLFRLVAGVRLEYNPNGMERNIVVRGNTADWCTPAVFIDGQQLRGITADDLDVWVRPDDIKGIEIYAGLGAPLQYQEAQSGCGSILIWTK